MSLTRVNEPSVRRSASGRIRPGDQSLHLLFVLPPPPPPPPRRFLLSDRIVYARASAPNLTNPLSCLDVVDISKFTLSLRLEKLITTANSYLIEIFNINISCSKLRIALLISLIFEILLYQCE